MNWRSDGAREHVRVDERRRGDAVFSSPGGLLTERSWPRDGAWLSAITHMSDEITTHIVETASRLFFAHGYVQTSINQLIEESGVARRTFYRRFLSKEAVAIACLDREAVQMQTALEHSASARTTPHDRMRGIFAMLESLARQTSFRCCGLHELAAALSNSGLDVWGRVRHHKTRQRRLLRALIEPRVDDETVDALNVLIEGAMTAAAAHLDVWPIRAALRGAETLLEATGEDKPRALPQAAHLESRA